MDFITLLIETLFKPNVFIIFVITFLTFSVLTIFIYIFSSNRQAKESEDYKIRLGQLYERQLDDYHNKNLELSKTVDSLKNQIKEQEKVNLGVDKLKEELDRKEDALRAEILAKEKVWAELKNSEKLLKDIKSQSEAKEKESIALNRLKEDFNKKEEELKVEIANKNKVTAEIKELENQLEKVNGELKSLQEVYSGLKEQYSDLESQTEVLNQELALEKTLHQRLKEEHANCSKPASS